MGGAGGQPAGGEGRGEEIGESAWYWGGPQAEDDLYVMLPCFPFVMDTARRRHDFMVEMVESPHGVIHA